MDELEYSIRAANPLITRRHSPLSPRAERELAELLDGAIAANPVTPIASAASPVRRAWSIGLPAAAAITLLTVLVGTSILASPAQQSFAGPPLLHATPMTEPLDEVLGELSALAREHDVPVDPDLVVVRFESWSASIEFGPGLLSYAVQPTEGVNVRRADGSGSIERRAGDTAYGVPDQGAELPVSGTLLERYDFDAGEYPMIYREGCPDSAQSLAKMLRADGVTDDSVAGDYFSRIQLLRMEWALTGAQTAAALDLIATLPDVELLGRVTDRLGREGIAIQTETTAQGAFRDILVFSPSTGHLLSSERVYLGGITNFNLSFPTVMDYAAWKDTPL